MRSQGDIDIGLGREQQGQRPRGQERIHRFRVTERRPGWHGGERVPPKSAFPVGSGRDCWLVRTSP